MRSLSSLLLWLSGRVQSVFHVWRQACEYTTPHLLTARVQAFSIHSFQRGSFSFGEVEISERLVRVGEECHTKLCTQDRPSNHGFQGLSRHDAAPTFLSCKSYTLTP